MARKALTLLLPASIAVLAGSQWRDISRYLKLRQMSSGGGHPENVPVKGHQAYPKDPGAGALDGTGDFNSASRGGPDADHREEAHPGRKRVGDEPHRNR
ncbi:MAG: hypothetical protein M3Z75_15325 [Actinomycetota bacterium]|nr:hypothetical protein [Actinomycetota bacterium]